MSTTEIVGGKKKLPKFIGVTTVAAALFVGVVSFGSPASAEPSSSGSHPSKEARFKALTDDQKACLANAGVARPSGRPTAEQTSKLVAAAKQCGIAVPANVGNGRPANAGSGRPANVGGRPSAGQDRSVAKGARFAQLSDAQRKCLADAGLTRPSSRSTPAQFRQLRDAAAKCGIAIPAAPRTAR